MAKLVITHHHVKKETILAKSFGWQGILVDFRENFFFLRKNCLSCAYFLLVFPKYIRWNVSFPENMRKTGANARGRMKGRFCENEISHFHENGEMHFRFNPNRTFEEVPTYSKITYTVFTRNSLAHSIEIRRDRRLYFINCNQSDVPSNFNCFVANTQLRKPLYTILYML